MYSATDATTKSARLFFISYMLTVNLLITQMIIGVVLDMFNVSVGVVGVGVGVGVPCV